MNEAFHDSLAAFLRTALSEELPGPEAQYRMTRHRQRPDPKEWKTGDFREGGVLLLLYPSDTGVSTVLMQRPDYPGVHSGQISFPGGKVEFEDRDIGHTAMREAEEELGILAENVTLLGRLTEVFIPPSRYRVTPVVGVSQARPEFVPDPKEVAGIIEAPLSLLSDPAIVKEKAIKVSSGFQIQAPYYDVYGNTVWGATAMMISEFLEVLQPYHGKASAES